MPDFQGRLFLKNELNWEGRRVRLILRSFFYPLLKTQGAVTLKSKTYETNSVKVNTIFNEDRKSKLGLNFSFLKLKLKLLF